METSTTIARDTADQAAMRTGLTRMAVEVGRHLDKMRDGQEACDVCKRARAIRLTRSEGKADLRVCGSCERDAR